MNERTLRLLEFETIRGRVADRCLSEEAAALVREDLPLTDAAAAAELKALTAEFLALIADGAASGAEEPRTTIPTVGPLIGKLSVAGLSLELEEAYALGLFVERVELLRDWMLRRRASRQVSAGSGKEGEGALAAEASALPDCSSVAREVFRVLDRDGALRDLPELREIKRRIQSLHRELDSITARYTGSEDTRRMLQSDVPSQRDGRIVLAVKANFRGRIKGIVHEVSSTGQTVFLEPEDVVEKNNEILIEGRRLDAEIARILRELTARIAESAPALAELHRKVLRLEGLRARARYGRETRGVYALEGSGRDRVLVLAKARHPLLGSAAVPIDLAMDAAVRTVIITGPNTGGKTVTLKTVGLFALMNQFGLAVPAEEGTTLPIFDGVYADIGDEQSISQSLSTFSSHMTNIASIAASATAGSLVLLDELGSGTDPEEGSAIAMAILDHFIAAGARLFTTTHHGILKNYGYSRQGVQNASVEFDGKTLSPTYRIIMGVPGESRALDIAARNGLPEDIVSAARGYLDEERADVSALISGLKEKHRELDAAEGARKAEERRLREERRKADLKELRLRQKELELKAAGVGSLQRLLSESRKTLENLVRELKEGEITREKTLKVKEFLSELQGTVAREGDALDREASRLAEDRKSAEEADAAAAAETAAEPGSVGGRSGRKGAAAPAVLAVGVGAEVLAGPSRRRGKVLRPGKKGYWVVEIGAMKMTLPERDLVPVAPAEGDRKPLVTQVDLASEQTAQMELNLRGCRLEDALDALRRQIDAAALSGLYEFSVIHGKGDGILQRGVHDFLKRQSVVEDYYFSRPEHGGFGKTVVSLKRG